MYKFSKAYNKATLLTELNKTNEVKFWLTIFSYFDVSMIMVIIIKKNKYLKKSQKNNQIKSD
jgi:hypothetical protein